MYSGFNKHTLQPFPAELSNALFGLANFDIGREFLKYTLRIQRPAFLVCDFVSVWGVQSCSIGPTIEWRNTYPQTLCNQ